jgi:2-dehydropantoate 2-reductase
MTAKPMKITVVGPGGVGGYFGARLAAAGNDVTFVARGAHMQAMQSRGLKLDSELGALHLEPVKVAADAGEVSQADAIIFAVKMRDTESAAESLRGLVSKGATIYTFQNGVESAERIGRIVGPGSVVEGAARIASNISEPGVVKQIGKFALLEFGEADGKPSARTTAFLEACKQAGITATLSDNISRTMWLKFAMLAPLAGMTALTRGPLGPIRANAESRALLQAAVEEVVAVGVAMQAGVEREDAAKTMKLIEGLPSAMMASMCHDLLAGKPIEVGGLSGAVARLGKAHGVAVPAHAFIAAALAPFTDGKPKV